MKKEVETIVERIKEHAKMRPDNAVYIATHDSEEDFVVTNCDLEDTLQKLGYVLKNTNVQNNRVLVMYPPGLDYIEIVLACFYVGYVAIPCYPFEQKTKDMIQNIIEDAKPGIIFSLGQDNDEYREFVKQNESICFLTMSSFDENAPRAEAAPVGQDDIAFLQYTSGSVGKSKGVMVTHRNLAFNINIIKHSFELSLESKLVIWLPPSHDMGLIGGLLTGLYVGFPIVFFTPNEFIQKPLRWLDAISRYHATVSGGPNFAFDLCIQKISDEQKKNLDLSSWTTAFCGAEPIHSNTFLNFFKAFEPCGFHYEALYPCYGLAEATLLVAGSKNDQIPSLTQFNRILLENGKVSTEGGSEERFVTLPSCGYPVEEQELLIVNPETCLCCAENEIGEIWIKGDSVAKGYWEKEDITKEVFGGYLADSHKGPYLRSGDMGFIFEDELYITGRLKEMLIIRGKNYYPNDLEQAVKEEHPILKNSVGTAFSITENFMEQLVMVFELPDEIIHEDVQYQDIMFKMNEIIGKRFLLQCFDILLVKEGEIPKTTSGKVSRKLSRDKYVKKAFTVYDSLAHYKKAETGKKKNPSQGALIKFLHALKDRDAKVDFICSFLVQTLEEQNVVMIPENIEDMSLIQLGIDSIKIIEITNHIQEQLDIEVGFEQLLTDSTIRQLAEKLVDIMFEQTDRKEKEKFSLERGKEYPLTIAQKHFWLSHKMLSDSSAYNVSSAIELDFDVNLSALLIAYTRLQKQHAILNARFYERDNEPYVIISVQEEKMELVCMDDWSEEQTKQYIEDNANKPFQFDDQPVIKCILLFSKEQKKKPVLIMVMHHIITDFWSQTLILNDLMKHYKDCCNQEPMSVTSDVTFLDFNNRQEEYIRSEQGADAFEFWKKYLDGSSLKLGFPADHVRPAFHSENGTTLEFHIDKELTDAVTDYCKTRKATVFNLMLAAYYAVLNRYTNDTDIVVGVPVAGRMDQDIGKVVGLCMNSLPVRAMFEEDTTLGQLIELVQGSISQIYKYQNYPFGLLAENLDIERDVSSTPVYQTVFIYQESSLADNEDFSAFAIGSDGYSIQIDGMKMNTVGFVKKGAQFDITLMISKTSKGFEISINYNTDIYEEETMKGLSECYIKTLREMVQDDTQKVSEYQFVSENIYQKVVYDWNNTDVEVPEGVYVPDILEKVAKEYPKKAALICKEQSMTFEELEQKAEQLAQYLMQKGIHDNTTVALLLDRSFELFISIFAVLKAGGTYVPIDLSYPKDRIEYLIENSDSKIFISKDRIAGQMGDFGNAETLYLDEGWENNYKAEQQSKRNIHPDDICYMLFTSGSTGKPKGVMVRHISLVNFVLSAGKIIAYSPEKTMITVSSVSFDIFMVDAIIPLLTGMTVVVPTEDEYSNPSVLRKLIADNNVKMVQTTPSKLMLMMDMGTEQGFLENMTDVIGGGEPFSQALLDILTQHDNLIIYNAYGPTETTVYSAFAVLKKDKKIVIGKPIDNTYIYILNDKMQPQMIGVSGDLYISGLGTAKGYRNLEEMTREKFVPDTFREGMVMYSTGDRAKWLPDGTIEFLGRNDNQVKMRGYRIELDEIKKRIMMYPGIKDAVVLIKEDQNKLQYLCAYLLVPEKGIATDMADYLGTWLPFYMIPTYFVELEQFPYTPNGKIDKNKLRTIENDTGFVEQFMEPETPTEKKLCDIWCSVLEIDKISTKSNFFLSKGDSLRATILLREIQKELDPGFKLRDVFQLKTIKEQAEYIDSMNVTEESTSVAVTHLADKHEYQASQTQARLYTLHALDNTHIAYNMPGLLILDGERVTTQKVEDIFRTLIVRHESLRTIFNIEQGVIMQSIQKDFTFQVDKVSVPTFDAEYIIKEFVKPFDLEKAPMIRITLLEKEDQQAIFVDIYHGVADGVSLDILAHEFVALFHGEELAELPYNYLDYTAWLEDYLVSEETNQKKEFWNSVLKGHDITLNLPYDYPKSDNKDFNGDFIEFYVGKELLEKAKAFCNKQGVTLYMYLMAVYQNFLSIISEEEDITIGTIVANRTNHNFQNIVGPFINTIPIRCQIKKDETFIEFLLRGKDNFIKALENQEFPYEMISSEYKKQVSGESLSTAFSFHNAEHPRIKGKSLGITSYELNRKISEFEMFLECFVQEEDIHFKMQYKTSLFERATIEEFIQNYLFLLKQTLENPGIQVKNLDLLDKEERELLLNMKGIEDSSYKEMSVIQKIEQQINKIPERIAVSDKNISLSYQKLGEQASLLADTIVERGIVAGSVIGFTAAQNCNMVISMLAIWKAGCVGIPINLDYPKERYEYMLEDSKCKAILNERNGEIEVALVESAAEETNDQFRKDENEVIYIIYTSGSTGKPKGVKLCNYGILNHAYTKIRETEMDENSVLANNLNKCFVASIWQVVAPLIIGARIEVISEETIKEPCALFEEVDNRKITVLEVVPSMLQMYLNLIEQGRKKADMGSLTYLLLTGEKVHSQLINQFYSVYRTPLINAYGQSECSDDTLHYHIPYQTDADSVPIGRPSNNTQFYILNRDKRLVKAGEKGMLYIAGPCLSDGYVNHEDLAREVFVENPFAKGTFMYCTGDIVRLNKEMEVEYIGRSDRQVKIRGFRIELGEIENVIRDVDEVLEAAVLMKDEKLVAFYCAKEAIKEDEVKEKIAVKLPNYMVPESLSRLDSMPLNSNGKTDYKALAQYKQTVKKSVEKPVNQIEEQLYTIWCEVLKKETVSVTESFFQLGGDSLISYLVIDKIEKIFKIKISYKDFFELSSIRNIAAFILQEILANRTVSQQEIALEVNSKDEFEPFPLTEIQEAYWFGRGQAYELGDVSAHGYLEFDMEHLDYELFCSALGKLITRHPMLRAVIDENGMQRILEKVPEYKPEIIQLDSFKQEDAEKELQRVREEMSHEVLASDTWPLFKVRVSNLQNQKSRIHLSIDMLIVDAFSLNILLKELGIFYAKEDSRLRELDITYRDYVVYENKRKEHEDNTEIKEYWKENLDKIYKAPELPMAITPDKLEKTVFHRHSAGLDSTKWMRLKELARELDVTPTAVMFGAFTKVLARWSSNQAFTINTTLFNRPSIHKDIFGIVGDFTTVLLLSVDTQQEQTFDQYVKEIQGKIVEQLDKKSMSGIELMREYSKEHDLMGKAVMPVVYTSIMDSIDGDSDKEANIFEDSLTYGISQTPQVYLDCQITEKNGTIRINWDVVDEMFPENMVEDMFQTFVLIVNALVEGEQDWTKELNVPLPAYQTDIIEKPEDTRKERKPEWMLNQFLHQVEEKPDAVAIIAGEETITYMELYKYAYAVSRWLIKNKEEGCELTAVVLEKGWQQIAGTIGSLLADMAYVPIDAKVPEERIRTIVESGGIRHILTSSNVAERLSSLSVHKLCLEEVDVTECEEPKKLRNQTRDLEKLAYIIYTSGSTGAPKGVMIHHAGAMNTINDMNERFSITEADRAIQLSSLSFDLSVYDIFGMLSAGGAVVVPDKEHIQDPEYWYNVVVDNEITVWNSVPAFMEMFVEYIEGSGYTFPASIKHILLSGDKIAVDLPQRIYKLSDTAQVVSLGGATEASIWSIIYPIAREYDATRPIPYGKSMDNQICYVMDEKLKIVPIHAVGEIVIGGIGVAKGYYNDEERTVEKFVRDETTGEILYKTGDLGRYRTDGTIEILGRMDSMVKVRGFRIELGEIETVINKSELVFKSAVVVCGDKAEEMQLVAYYIPSEEAAQYEKQNAHGAEENVIEDPIERLRFKMEHHNISKIESNEVIDLNPEEMEEEKYLRRRSIRRFNQQLLEQEKFLALLKNLCALNYEQGRLHKFQYASAGNLYPVQTYICIKNVEGMNPGIFYLQPYEGKLNRVDDNTIHVDDYASANKEIYENAAFSIYFVGKLDGIRPLYGSWSEKFCYIEAGAMSHMLESLATEQNIGLCQIGGFEFDKVRKLFHLTEDCIYLHGLTGGSITEEVWSKEAFIEDNQNALLLQKEIENTTIKKGVPKKIMTGNMSLTEELEQYVRQYLADYMVPTVWVKIDEFPLSANGKIDYKKLRQYKPELKKETKRSKKQQSKGDSAVEKKIMEIWEEELGVHDIDIDDNFFDVGGTSVKLVRIYNKMCAVFEIKFQVVEMFKYTTIRKLSAYVETCTKAQSESDTEDKKKTENGQTMKQKKIDKYRMQKARKGSRK